jgi:glycosyltransferase involved in cell wall biosynthesis
MTDAGRRRPAASTPGAIWQLVDTSSVGGIERHVATLADGLRRRGGDCVVVLYQDHGRNPWLAQLADAGLPVRILDGSVVGLYRALREARPAILHTHGYKAGILGRIAALAAGTPVVSTFHSGEDPPFPLKLYYRLDAWSSLTSRRIAVSEVIRRKIPWRSELIPNYLVPPSAPPSAPLPRRVGFVGRLSHEKAPDIFCELARRSPPGIEWHVWGDGRMRADLEARFGDVVTFHGVVTDVRPVWDSIGLLVMPSRAEGLPLAALEALSMGVPVLASRVGGVPTIVRPGETGWLIDVGDVDGALAAVADWDAMGIEAGRELRHRCWRHVVDHFSEQRHLPDILGVYERAGVAVAREPVTPAVD